MTIQEIIDLSEELSASEDEVLHEHEADLAQEEIEAGNDAEGAIALILGRRQIEQLVARQHGGM